MSGNTSATGGYLAPAAMPAPAEDAALEDVLQVVVVGLSGLTPALVRPRWQPTPPARPAAEVTWCAIGVTRQAPDANAWVGHDGTGDGSSELRRHETVEALLSCYGPGGAAIAGRIRDGLQIGQNRDGLGEAGLAFVETGEVIAAPELVNNQWLRRHDLALVLRREIRRVYPIRTILSATPTVASSL
jgi:hypothetical protein